MPSYDYKCFDCSITETIVQSINATAANPSCHKCGKPMSRIYTSPPVRFRGSGWGSNR